MTTVDDLNARGQGYLHAAAVLALTDTACGYGTFTDLPDGATTLPPLSSRAIF